MKQAEKTPTQPDAKAGDGHIAQGSGWRGWGIPAQGGAGENHGSQWYNPRDVQYPLVWPPAAYMLESLGLKKSKHL